MLDAFDAVGGEALKLPDCEFVDLPVKDRAQRPLDLAAGLPVVM